MTRLFWCCLAVGMLAAAPAGADVSGQIGYDGMGPVRFGMSVEAVERALGARLDPRDTLVFLDSDCYITHRSDGSDPGIDFTIHNGQLSRIDVWQPREVAVAPGVKTAEGIGIGSAEAEVKMAYGSRLDVKRSPDWSEEGEAEAAEERRKNGITIEEYPEFWMHLDGPDGRGVIFVTQAGKVTSIVAGVRDDINAMEMCR